MSPCEVESIGVTKATRCHDKIQSMHNVPHTARNDRKSVEERSDFDHLEAGSIRRAGIAG